MSDIQKKVAAARELANKIKLGNNNPEIIEAVENKQRLEVEKKPVEKSFELAYGCYNMAKRGFQIPSDMAAAAFELLIDELDLTPKNIVEFDRKREEDILDIKNQKDKEDPRVEISKELDKNPNIKKLGAEIPAFEDKDEDDDEEEIEEFDFIEKEEEEDSK
jgi:hypothetical protein